MHIDIASGDSMFRGYPNLNPSLATAFYGTRVLSDKTRLVGS